VGAVCGKTARTDLCGGRVAIRVPTAIPDYYPDYSDDYSDSWCRVLTPTPIPRPEFYSDPKSSSIRLASVADAKCLLIRESRQASVLATRSTAAAAIRATTLQ
jgi:hypothetical protein